MKALVAMWGYRRIGPFDVLRWDYVVEGSPKLQSTEKRYHGAIRMMRDLCEPYAVLFRYDTKFYADRILVRALAVDLARCDEDVHLPSCRHARATFILNKWESERLAERLGP